MKRFLRFQLSLRVLLALMIGLALWMGVVTRRAQRQREIVDWILRQGGDVLYDEGLDMAALERNDLHDYSPINAGARPARGWIPLPTAWKAWLGRDYEWSVVHVKINVVKAEDVSSLADLGELRSLVIANGPVRKIPFTAHWRKLFRLKVMNCPIEVL